MSTSTPANLPAKLIPHNEDIATSVSILPTWPTQQSLQTHPPARKSLSIQAHTLEPWSVHALSFNSPAISGMLMASSMGLLLALFWLRIRRLSSLLRRRDQRIRSLLVMASPVVWPYYDNATAEKAELATAQPTSANPEAGELAIAELATVKLATAETDSTLRRQQALKAALVRQELRVRYQPIVELSTARTTGFEALVRWQHPELGWLSPDAFLPLAEEMGLIVDIDRWVLAQACQQLVSWRDDQLMPSLSVNISGSHLSRPDLVAFVQGLLARYSIAPRQLNLEVTESVMITEPQRVVKTLNQLRAMGLRVSLDDFGTGYCSLQYLQQFPVDVLKIDKSFIDGLNPATSNGKSETIVRSVLTMAQGLDIQVVAEGIERHTQCRWLRESGCTYGQGHSLAKALTSFSARSRLIDERESANHSTEHITKKIAG